MATTTVPEFHAPGPGVWEMDSMHFAKPQFGVIAEVFPPAFTADQYLQTADTAIRAGAGKQIL